MSSEAEPVPSSNHAKQLWQEPENIDLVEKYNQDPLHEEFAADPAFAKAFLLNERIKVTEESQSGWSDEVAAKFEYLDNQIKNLDVMMELHWGSYHRLVHTGGPCSCGTCRRVEDHLKELHGPELESGAKTLATGFLEMLLPKPAEAQIPPVKPA
jgi:hypothetical protein